MDLREIGCGGMDWIDLAEDRDQWRALVNFNVTPSIIAYKVLLSPCFLSSCLGDHRTA
jgi:hypothetical protein